MIISCDGNRCDNIGGGWKATVGLERETVNIYDKFLLLR